MSNVKKPVVAELIENIAGWDRIKSALDDMRACHAETLTFFNDTFNQLDSFYESLLVRGCQQSLLEKQRAEIGPELQLVRSQAEEMTGLLVEQKRSAELQQNKYADELQQMRAMLETLTRQIVENLRQTDPAPTAKSPSGVAAVALVDPVLESVLAQFEVLQHDRLLRRSANAECLNNKS